MSEAGYFRLLKMYSDIWARRHYRVVLSGEENITTPRDHARIYIVSHPVTWDLPMLAHMGRNNYYVIVDKGPFAHPLVKWLFKGCGFLKLEGDNSDEVLRRAGELAVQKKPVIVSLYGYGVDFGEEVRPRSGGIRIAHAARADIYPVHLWIEDGKRIMKSFRTQGKSYPFSVFHDTLYFATFCPPLRHAEWAGETLSYEDATKLALQVEEGFTRREEEIRAELRAGRWDGTSRRGGTDHQVLY